MDEPDDKVEMERAVTRAYEFLALTELATIKLRKLTLRPIEYLTANVFEQIVVIANEVGQLASENGAIALRSAAVSAESIARVASREEASSWGRHRDQIADLVGVMEGLVSSARRELGIGGT